jgi:hypothetical protein
MPISRVSSQALKVLAGHRRLEIHSVFESAVNLRAGRRLINCSTGVISIPWGIEMTPVDLGRLRRHRGATLGDVLEWRSSDLAIVSPSNGVMVVSTPQTLVFDPTLPHSEGTRLSAAARELTVYLTHARARTGFGSDWANLASVLELADAVDALIAGVPDRRVLHWIGRGPGLTPSGDDILVGMIAALWFVRVVDSGHLASLCNLVEELGCSLTTDISAEYLYYACHGRFSGAVRDLLVALDQSDRRAALGAVGRLERYGHTSGIDCTLGIVTALHQVSGVARRPRAPDRASVGSAARRTPSNVDARHGHPERGATPPEYP